MDYGEAVQYIYRVSWTERRRGLHRIRKLLDMMGNPQRGLKFIHIAGTNGKGSAAAMLYSILRSAGYSVGLFTSPHLVRINERIQADGKMIGDAELAGIADRISESEAALEEQPTVFEKLTAIGMEYFKRCGCEYVVLEAGMGGEFDSTNVIDCPELEVITSIGFDHMAQLGNTLAEIASAKAGIIKENSTVVVYGGDEEVCRVFRRTADERNARLVFTDFSHLNLIGVRDGRYDFTFGGFSGTYSLPLMGEYQLKNVSVVMTAVGQLRERGARLTDMHVRKGLDTVSWAARFEKVLERPVFIVDGAHNPQGIRAAAESLESLYGGRRIVFLLGVMKDKNVEEMLDILAGLSDTFVTLTPDSPRAMEAAELAACLAARGLRAAACESVEEGVAAAISEAGQEGVVCSLGSLYLAGAVRELCLGMR